MDWPLIFAISTLFIVGVIGHETASTLRVDPEVSMTVPEIVSHWGYPVEVVPTTTSDGYVLEMHRIPYGKDEFSTMKKDKNCTNNQKPVVFLQHGLEGSSANWVTNLPSQSAGFIYADAGYDVWMGNSRGNTYSTKHTSLDVNSHQFWKFSWDEMARYDLDAMINKVLNMTNRSDLYYIGHSQGTLIMFTKLAVDQDFGSKIRKFFTLAPVTTVGDIKGLLYYMGEYFYPEVQFVFDFFGQDKFLPNDRITKLLAKYVCGSFEALNRLLCQNLIFLIAGPESNQLNATRIPVYFSHSPADTSTTNILHWAQMVRNKRWEAYDWGSPDANIYHYGQPKPPVYNVSRVNAETYLYWSDTDWLADPGDIRDHILPNFNASLLMGNVNLHDFNHMDFIWGLRAADEIYRPIREIIDADVKMRF